MASDDVVISAPAIAAVPQSYTVPLAQQIIPKCITATIDGTGAATNFLPTLQIIAPGGNVVARCPTGTQVAAGGSAEVSWFRIVNAQNAVATSAYQVLALSLGPSGYYKLDEPSGTTMFDSSGFSRDGSYANAPTLGSNPLIGGQVVGNVGSAVTFNAAASQRGDVQFPTANGLVSANFTIALWGKTTQSGATLPSFAASDDSAAARWFQLRISATGTLEFICFSNVFVGFTKTGSIQVNDGVRHFLVGTFDASNNITIYVDGAQDGAPVAGPAAHSTSILDFTVADRYTGAHQNFYTGVVDEVAVYPYALTAVQVASLYASR